MQTIPNRGLDFALQKDVNISSAFATAIPPPTHVNTLYTGPSGDRKRIKIPADSSTVFNSKNRKIYFTLKSHDFLDLRNAKLTFFAKTIAPGGSTYCRFPQNIHNVIRDVTVYSVNDKIFENMEKNRYRSMIWNFSRDSTSDNAFSQQWGIGNSSTRNTWSSGKKYMIPLNIQLLESEEMPMFRFDSIRIELTLEEPVELLESDVSSGLEYEISNPEIICEEVKYQSDIRNMYQGRDLYWAYTTYECYHFNNTSNKTSLKIDHRSQAIERIFATIQRSADMKDPTVNNKFDTFLHDNITHYQFKINNDYYPKEVVNCSNTGLGDTNSFFEGYENMIESTNLYFMNDRYSERYRTNGDCADYHYWNLSINENQFTTDKFLIAHEFLSYKYVSEDLISKQDWSNAPNVYLNLEFSQVPSGEQKINVFVVYKKVFVLKADNKAFVI